MTKCNLARAAKCIEADIASDIPAHLWGAPGVGKSDVVRQIAKRMSLPIIEFRASLRDAVDLRGLPLVDAVSGTSRWLPPSELPNAKRDGERGILFLDELNVAPQSVQAACYGLVLDKRLG